MTEEARLAMTDTNAPPRNDGHLRRLAVTEKVPPCGDGGAGSPVSSGRVAGVGAAPAAALTFRAASPSARAAAAR